MTITPSSPSVQDFFGFAISLNCVIFSYDGKQMQVLLVDESELHKGLWAVPGDGLAGDESFDSGAQRVMVSLNSDSVAHTEQSVASSQLEHFEKGSLMTVAYYSTVSKARFSIDPSLSQRRISWWPIDQLPKLTKAHSTLIEEAFSQLKGQVRKQPLGFYLLDNKFTIFQLQCLFETVLQTKYDRPNFRRKVLATGLLEPLEVKEESVNHRPAKMFRFNNEKYALLSADGFKFSL